MAALIRLNERATVQQRSASRDPAYGRKTEAWNAISERIWVEVKDVLPSRAESSEGGVQRSSAQARLRLRRQIPIATGMRVVLHGRGDRVMQVIAGPALLDDRTHIECMIEEIKNG